MAWKSVLILLLSVMISYVQCDGVRAGPPSSRSQSNSVRSGTDIQSVKPNPVQTTDENTAGVSSPDSPVPAVDQTGPSPANPAPVNPSNPATFSGVRDQFVGGVSAIRDSAGKLIGLTVGGVVTGVANAVHSVKEGVVGAVDAVGQGVANAVRPVVDFGGRVVNKTVQIGSNVAHAGGQIVDVWGQSLSETKNITGQLIGRRRRAVRVIA